MATLPIAPFLTERLQEYDNTFELRVGTGFEQLFFEPLEFIVQPLRDEANQIQIAQSFRRILLTDDPDAFDQEAVDALANNLFVFRNTGELTGGTARAYYSSPLNREWPANGAVFTGNNSVTYANPEPFQITAAEMSSQIEGGLYYYDIPVQALTTGDNTLDIGGLVSLNADPDYVSVTNKAKLVGGTPAETNTELITRTQNSIAVRDLVTGKGFNAILFSNFQAFLKEIQPVGFGDPEMMRDIVYNTHIGGRVDGYVKTSTVLQGSKAFTGLALDTTRQSFTSRNLILPGTQAISVGNPNIDRANNLPPIVQQVKVSTKAVYVSTATFPANLTSNSYLKLGINGQFLNILLAGVNPSATTLNETINAINTAFAQTIAVPFGTSYKLTSPTIGTTSQIASADPDVGVSAAVAVLGAGAGPGSVVLAQGTGPIVFVEGSDYLVDDTQGTIQRVPKPARSGFPATTGQTTTGIAAFVDNTAGIFTNVGINDILTITAGPDAGDYRILNSGGSGVHTLTLDKPLTTTATNVHYSISPPGIKNGETVFIQYYFNPLSIDIGGLVKLDPLGKARGIRPGRDDAVITDTAFLRINSIELIDPLTLEPIGTVLNGVGGYGAGPYGAGPYGIGGGADYYLVVNDPGARFSAFEDSYIVISSSFLGFSFQINYDYVPEIQQLHAFARSDAERTLDGDVLMKHMLPAYVSGNINYSIDTSDSSVPSNATLQAFVNQFISGRVAGQPLFFSEIRQFITRVTDPFDRFGTEVESFQLTATIHNTDGSTTIATGKNEIDVPVNTPSFTTKPLSPRITHWIAEDVTLTRTD